MRSLLRAAVVLVAIADLIGGCASPATAPATGLATSPGTATPPTADPAASADGGPSAAPVSEVLGTASYTVDAARRVEAPYAADGQPATLSATDASGATWTVTVPAGALPRSATIAMTPLAKIDAQLPGTVLGGMLLEPEGTQFLLPVDVSVTGGKGILQGAADGTVTFAMPGDGGWGTAQLWHFSPEYAFDPNEAVWARDVRAIAEDTGRAMAEARELLKSKDFQIPGVPSISWECRDDSGWKSADAKISEFITAFLDPENALIRRLLKGAKMAQLIGLNTDAVVMSRAGDLSKRLGQKAVKLLELTKGQPDKILPVIRTVLLVSHDKALLGVEYDALLAALGPWAEASLDPVVRAIREEHDYAQAAVAWEVARYVEMFAGKGMVDTVDAKLKSALAFTAELKLALHHPESLGALLEERLGATVKLEFVGAGAADYLRGTAQGDYLSVQGSEDNVRFKTPSFAVEAHLSGVDLCAGTATLVIPSFGSPDEAKTYTDSGHTYVTKYAQGAFWARFGSYWVTAPVEGVGFPVKLHNKSATWIDQSFDSTDNNDQTGTFEVTVTHTPG